MTLPPFPVIDAQVLAAIAARHGLGPAVATPLPQVGIFNTLYALGDDVILRVPRDHARFTGASRNEAIAVPLARAAGVRTPALIAFDDSGELLPVPYTIYERVAGHMLEGSMPDPTAAEAVWRELGADLARLHLGVERLPPATDLEIFDDKTDPRPLPGIIARAGYFTGIEADWLTAWLDRLAPHATAPVAEAFLHGDTQMSNTMIDAAGNYRAVIDWGGARWGDPAHDFAGVPLRAVPALLAGYRTVAATDETIEARIVLRHLTIGLHQLRGTPKPDQSWGERPLTNFLDAVRFFGEARDQRWEQWRP